MSEQTSIFATFSTRHVPALVALALDMNNGEFRWHGIQIEPCGASGGLLVATNNAILVWVNDPTASVSRPFVLDVCKDFARACRPPRLPVLFDCNGDEFELPVPPQCNPHKVVLICTADGGQELPESSWHDGGYDLPISVVTVVPEGVPEAYQPEAKNMGACLQCFHGRVPGITQVVGRKILPWAKVLPTGDPNPIGTLMLASHQLRLLSKFGEGMRFRFYGEKSPVLVDFDGDPLVHAAIMPCDLDKFRDEGEEAASSPAPRAPSDLTPVNDR